MSNQYILAASGAYGRTYVSFERDAGHIISIRDNLLHHKDATRIDSLEEAVRISNKIGPFLVLKVVTTTSIEDV